MIRRIDRYLIREFVPPFLLGLFVLTFTLVTQLIVKLTEWLINKGVGFEAALRILLLSLPYLLVLTVPMAVLTGILMAFGRLSSDSEIVAFKANGVSVYRLALPIFIMAALAYGATTYLYVGILPSTNMSLKQLKFQILKSRASIGMKPHVFNTFFDNHVIYIEEIDDKTGTLHGVFLSSVGSQKSRVFFANSARKIVDEEKRLLTMELRDGIWHQTETGASDVYGLSPFQTVRFNLELDSPGFGNNVRKGYREMTLAELRKKRADIVTEIRDGKVLRAKLAADPELTEVAKNLKFRQIDPHLAFRTSQLYRLDVEVQKKFAIPFACIIFALIGVPLGIRGTRTGRSAGFAISVGLFLLYYLLLVGGEGLGNEGSLPAWIAIWGANLVFGLVGLVLIVVVGRESLPAPVRWVLAGLRRGFSVFSRRGGGEDQGLGRVAGLRLLSFPKILDLYIGRDWIVIFFGLVLSITLLTAIVHLFEKLEEFNRYQATMGEVFRYLAARLPDFGVIVIHVAALVATVLVVSGLNRRSELTAMRAGTVPLLRVAMPLLFLGLVVSGGVWLLTEEIVPKTNRKANDIYDYEIRGRKPKKLAFNRNWYRASHRSILFYSLQQKLKDGGVSLNRFTLFRIGPRGLPVLRIDADKAVWMPVRQKWVYHNAVVRRFDESGGFLLQVERKRLPSDLEEKPSDFERELSDADEMNYRELGEFIATLSSQGADVQPYRVDLYGKLSFCLISFVMVMVGFPFAAISNRSGRLALGIVVAIVIGITFFVAYRVGISIGRGGGLSPLAAAFGPLLCYFGLGVAFLFRME